MSSGSFTHDFGMPHSLYSISPSPALSVSHLPHLLPPDEDSAPSAPLPYVSAETKVPLRAFSHSIFL